MLLSKSKISSDRFCFPFQFFVRYNMSFVKACVISIMFSIRAKMFTRTVILKVLFTLIVLWSNNRFFCSFTWSRNRNSIRVLMRSTCFRFKHFIYFYSRIHLFSVINDPFERGRNWSTILNVSYNLEVTRNYSECWQGKMIV